MYLRKAIRGTVIIFLLSLMTGLFGYFIRLTLARKLSVSDFGLFYAVMAVFLFIVLIVDSGIGSSLTKKIIEYRIKNQFDKINRTISSTLIVQIAFSALIAAILYLSSPYLSKNFFHGDVTGIMMVLGLWVMTIPIFTTATSILYGFQKSEVSASMDTIKNFSVLLLSLLLLYLGYGLMSPAWGYLLANIFVIIILLFAVKRIYPQFNIRMTFEWKLFKPVFLFGMYVFLAGLVWVFITQTDTLVITYFMSSSDIGYYQTALAIAYIVLYITNAITVIVFPIVSELKSKKQDIKISEGINLIYKYIMIFLVPGALLMFMFPELFITLLFTDRYLPAIDALKILAITTFFVSLTQINNQVMIALDKPKKVAQIMLIIAAVNLVLNILLVPIYGIAGAAFATFLSFVFATIISSVLLNNLIKIKYPLKSWFMLIITSILMVLIVRNISLDIVNMWFKLIILAAIFCMIYLGLLLLLRIIDFKEIKELLRIVR